MTAITIRGQLGSGAPEIGILLAERLHIDFVDREIITHVAQKLNWKETSIADKEMPPGTFKRKLADILKTPYIYTGSNPMNAPTLPLILLKQIIPPDDFSYLNALKYVITELAKSSSIVIRGRGSQFILKDFPGSFHVLVVAPLELRIKRVMEELKIGPEDAKKQIKEYDSSRREFVKRYFKAEAEDPVNYDFVINTEHLGFNSAINIITNALPLKK